MRADVEAGAAARNWRLLAARSSAEDGGSALSPVSRPFMNLARILVALSQLLV